MKQKSLVKFRIQTEKHIMKLSFVGSVLFMFVEGVMAYVTHSHSLLMDFVFDITDLIMIGPFLVLVPLLYKPVTERRPYGFSQVESLFLIIKYSVLLAVTVRLVADNIRGILNGGYKVDAGAIAFFEFCVFLGCLFMYLLLSRCSKEYESDSIRAELYIWKLDVISSIGVSIAFMAHLLLEKTSVEWIVPYIDPAVAIIMSVLLIIEPVKMIGVSLKELVLFAPNDEIMDEIRSIAESKMEDYPYEMKFLDVIQTGRKTWVEIYISSKSDCVSISSLKTIRDRVKEELRNDFDQIYVEVIPDIVE